VYLLIDRLDTLPPYITALYHPIYNTHTIMYWDHNTG